MRESWGACKLSRMAQIWATSKGRNIFLKRDSFHSIVFSYISISIVVLAFNKEIKDQTLNPFYLGCHLWPKCRPFSHHQSVILSLTQGSHALWLCSTKCNLVGNHILQWEKNPWVNISLWKSYVLVIHHPRVISTPALPIWWSWKNGVFWNPSYLYAYFYVYLKSKPNGYSSHHPYAPPPKNC